jgi:putative SOS response-associated peptidase YedK
MCGRFDTSGLSWADIHAQLSGFAPVRTAPLNLEPNPDVRPTTRQLVARIEDGAWILDPMRWGLIPFWYKARVKPSARGAGDGFKMTTINARVEDVAAKPAYRGAFARRRAIVPASAWWEWHPETKVKHRLARADGRPLWFAGLWDKAVTTDEGELQSFTILTGPAAGALEAVHHRAPVILEPEDWPVWLDPAQDAQALMAAVRPELFVVTAAQDAPQ